MPYASRRFRGYVVVPLVLLVMSCGDTARPLLPAGPAERGKWQSACESAVRSHDAVQLEELLSKGRPSNIDSLLATAAGLSNVTIVRILLQHGANPNAGVNGINETPLIEAARVGAVGVADVLLKAGAEPDGKAGPGRCCAPLHYAITRGHLGVASVLLSAKANPDLRFGTEFLGKTFNNETGPTPLMLAAALGRDDIVEALLNARADPALVDGDRRTAAGWLKEYQCPAARIAGLLGKSNR
jgi:ankyrin repeat protein